MKAFITEDEKARIENKDFGAILEIEFFTDRCFPIYIGNVENFGPCWVFEFDTSYFDEEEFNGERFLLGRDEKWVLHEKQEFLFLRLND